MKPNNNLLVYGNQKGGNVAEFYNEHSLPDSILADIHASQITKRHQKSKNTLTSYAGAWAEFINYCTSHDVSFLPADPLVVGAYLQNISTLIINGKQGSCDRFYSPASLKLRLAAIRHYHGEANLRSPTEHPNVTGIMRAISNADDSRAVADNQKRAMINEYFERIMAAVMNQPASSKLLRDKAILLLGRQGGFRRAELVNLKIKDIEVLSERLRVTLRHHKTSSKAGRHVKSLPKDELFSCYYAMVEWLEYLEKQQVTNSNSHLFRSLKRNGDLRPYNSPEAGLDGKFDLASKPSGFLVGNDILRMVKKYTAAACIDADPFGAHSLRSGCVTQMFFDGARSSEIKKRTGHRSTSTVDRYTQIPD
ncbi:tyrosine-type recombinase/integrase [Shewanella colwelliana]|uniref:tyrosine-type recombinase/integrase n=1 Tax=Shewanella colwelliana TaxID=23 RepID=UPI0022AE8453|nr:tyrosine-type recombinase/integrase [Shewanella colwelliana]MCZ4337715.1 tyrosine-type recombinase/integrase [Shewanella colwelliana]